MSVPPEAPGRVATDGRKQNGRSGACEAGNLPFFLPSVIGGFDNVSSVADRRAFREICHPFSARAISVVS
jgi:hypothetical protein